MNLVFLVSREWSAKILKNLSLDRSLKINKTLIFFTENKYLKDIKIAKGEKKKISPKNLDLYLKKIKNFKPKIIFAFGWSGYLSAKIRRIAPCLILHPSKLPKFRGGSPIQNQLLKGVKNSAVSIIEAVDKIDSGDIFFQKKISFKGYLDDIQNEIISKGSIGAKKIIKQYKSNNLKCIKQKNKFASYYKRRTPEMSEILYTDFKKHKAEYFYNLIRGLQKPYPEAFIKCKGNSKLYFEKVYFKNK